MLEKIAQRLRELRAQHSLTKVKVAELCGRDPSTVGNWEDGTNPPPADVINVLATHYKVSADYLVGISDHPSGIAPNSWIVDQDMLDEIERTGTYHDPDEQFSQPLPPRFLVLSSSEYAALVDRLRKRRKE